MLSHGLGMKALPRTPVGLMGLLARQVSRTSRNTFSRTPNLMGAAKGHTLRAQQAQIRNATRRLRAKHATVLWSGPRMKASKYILIGPKASVPHRALKMSRR